MLIPQYVDLLIRFQNSQYLIFGQKNLNKNPIEYLLAGDKYSDFLSCKNFRWNSEFKLTSKVLERKKGVGYLKFY